MGQRSIHRGGIAIAVTRWSGSGAPSTPPMRASMRPVCRSARGPAESAKTLGSGIPAVSFDIDDAPHSFRHVLLIVTTIALAATNIVPGLICGHQHVGFTSTLGVTALAGVVVHNANALLDLADGRRREGESLEDATRDALRARTRPILLTSGTTVIGLVPLAISESSLWPPLAWAMIPGLTASTLLTLLVVPALYVYAMRLDRDRRGRIRDDEPLAQAA